MLTLTRQGLLLSLSATVIPSQGSSDVPVAVVNDINTYVGYTLEPRVGYYLNGIYKSTVCPYDTSAKTFSVPAEAFKQIGIIDITLALIDNANANHIETCQTVHATVNKAPLGTVVLPDQTTWQDYVNSYMNQLFDSNYKPQFDQIQQDLENLVTEAQQQQQTAEQQQTQIDNAISVMGEYQIVSNDPVQIQFKKGDGTYGPTVDLGDGLASKSMVNAGYYQSIGSQYSGAASDYGIQVEEIVGAYTQETTTGAQLWRNGNPSTLSGVTLTILDDGWINLNGTATADNNFSMVSGGISLETGSYTFSAEKQGSFPNNSRAMAQVYSPITTNNLQVVNNASSSSSSGTLNEANDYQLRIRIDKGFTYNNAKLRVMFQKGSEATPWEPYTGGAPSPNPDYAQEMQAVEISELKSCGRNLFSGLIKGSGINSITGAEQVSNVSACSDYIPVKAGQEYYISGLSNTINSFVAAYDYEKNFIGRTSGAVASGRALNNTTLLSAIGTGEIEKLAYLRVTQYVSIGNSGTIDDVDGLEIMLNVGDTAEPYTPYTGADTVTLSEPLILRALPNGVADSYEDGVITRHVGGITFVGISDEIFTVSDDVSSGFHRFGIAVNNYLPSSYSINVICDRFDIGRFSGSWNDYNTNQLVIFSDTYLRFVVSDDITGGTLEGFKSWLQSNPIKVWYQLATPTTEQLAIPTLQSFYPFTNAWCDSIVQPQITWNVLTGKSSILDGNGNLIQQGYMTPQDNLLINSDFRSGIINQKGQTQYVHSSGARIYGIDCWYVTGENSSMATNDEFLSINLHNNGDFGCVLNIDKTNEKYLTFTIQRNLVEAQSVTFDVSTMNENQDYFFDIDDNTKIGIYFWESSKAYKAWFYLKRDGVTNIDFMKLERGKYFTGMPAWNEAEELLKCQRYLFSCHKISGYGFETGGGNVYIYVNIPTPMKKQGAIRVGSTLQVIGDGAYKTLTISGVNVSSQDNNLVILSGVLSEVGNINIVKVFEFTNFTLDAYDY